MKKTLVVLCSTATLLAVAGPASAAKPKPPKTVTHVAKGAKTSLLLTVYTMGGQSSTKLDAWYLGCQPPKGTHPDYKHACRVLEKVDGWFEAINDRPGVCTDKYEPVTLTAEGTWKGRDIYWTSYYANRCVAAASTQDVFPV